MSALLLATLLAILPPAENEVVAKVAADCKLNAEQTALLAAIRRAENGRPHIAFGVADPRCRTFRKQARWAANTIHLRYDGDLAKFAARWCPNNAAVWERNVRWFMRRQGVSK